MRISENKIEEIRITANIVDVISEYVQLRKRGKNYIGLCPFHSEKTPSFTVSEEKQMFNCFGCHKGGNVYKFLMEYEKISFIESVQELAQKYGINIELDEESSGRQSEQEILYDINTEAARYFSNNLLNHPETEIAREYFQKRKIKPQTLRSFGLGYAFPGWDHFVNYAQERKIDLERAIALGLIGQSTDGRLYDKFPGRIIFPIFSPNGRVVAFAGRIIENKENAAKYLNSPESLIYIKGRILYGLSHAKDEIRKLDKAILVEGYMDLISLHQSGIKNVVAVSGTALTEEQVQLLSRYTKNVVLLFDADTAGIKASMRSIELLLKKDMEIKIASLPAGEDPDSFVNNYGREKFEEVIKKAQNFLEYQSAYFESKGMFDDPSKTAEAIRELVKPVSIINDELKRSLLIKTIAKKFNLREKLLENELDKAIQSAGKQITNEERIKNKELIKKNVETKLQNDKKISPRILRLEKEIIKLLFEGNKEVVEYISSRIPIEDFSAEAHTKIAELVYNACNNNEEIIAGSLIEKINNEELQLFIRDLIFDKYSISRNWEDIYPGLPHEKILQKISVDTVKRYLVEKINYIIKINLKLIESTEDENERFELMKLISNLEKEKMKVKQETNLES
ncbi:MAG: DNA primase [Bacteroidetes bacterium]|nr:DNA primase [Bacteroidota bacterium]